MTMSSIQLRQTLFKRGNTVETGSYVGPIGEAVIDTDQLTFRIQDGVTPGGHLMASSNWLSNVVSTVSRLQANISTAYGNANVAAYLSNYTGTLVNSSSIQTLTSEVGALQSNTVGLQNQINRINSNVSVIQTLTANINAFETWANATFSTSHYGNIDVAGYLSNNPLVPQIVNAPEHNYGQAGDRAGTIAFDSNYIYYCTENFVDGVTAIWQRTAWTAGTW
jgi:hypothetical protein